MAPARRAFLGSLAVTVGLAGCTGGPGDAGGQSTDTESPTPTDTQGGKQGDATTDTPTASQPDATVTVGPGGDLRFEPETLEVTVGATVQFVWDSGGHTVTVDSQPDGADWAATGQETESAGFTHTHTFEVEGQYDYYCVPHRGAGMVGSVVVGDGSMGADTATTTATPSPSTTPTPQGTRTPTPTSSDGGGGDGDGGGYY